MLRLYRGIFHADMEFFVTQVWVSYHTSAGADTTFVATRIMASTADTSRYYAAERRPLLQ